MFRIVLYVIILSIIVFMPFSVDERSKERVFKHSAKSMIIKIIEPKPLVKEKRVTKHVKAKPKKVIKKVIKKKKPSNILPKKVPVVEKEKVQERSTIVQKTIKKVEVPAYTTSEAEKYFTLIYEEIDKNKYYPKKSRKFRQEDTIFVSFLIDKNGYISNLKIKKFSEFSALNKAVKRMFKKIKRLKKPPNGMQTPLEMSVEINFKLER